MRALLQSMVREYGSRFSVTVMARCSSSSGFLLQLLLLLLGITLFEEIEAFKAPSYASPECRIDLGSSSKCNNKISAMRTPTNKATEERVVNRRESPHSTTPEKRQRVPSAYNQFIKEEIQRIKANNPDISHREAFSTAAKNWAHFPHIHFGLMLEANNQPKLDDASGNRLMSRTALRNK
ncbi:hypothetical protein CISIN_1g028980mg [Citrus sinensis]|uniref:YABBY protein C-terminal domain-containing protein n=1 Tax=Citrus sinensis TaxID=2711 RepID=A0A067GKS6_CITSI|nr:hypothetical protein CISIN_1g028980mg [Citrus sinensis]KDO80210.1 hypothetical protein CISIN_1g028980mg [Citrus sinensis]